MMDITKSREEFYKWLESRDCNPVAWLKDAYWEVWKASRESIEVEFPKRNADAYTERDWDGNHGGRSRNNTIDECAEALRTAGIRIKGESE
ncbi:hypothetical protein ACMU9U_004101 [Yersinia enterocolitica]|nr:hypothetical protein [Yersinia enterocolitica]HDL6714486.1 hypothetical protein [Yersinia enterocolitica]HEI6980773.1 hypothetical protein [Yersinia enterocolitica]